MNQLPSDNPGTLRRSSNPGASVMRSVLVALVVVIALRLLGGGGHEVQAVVELRSMAGTDGEVFYAAEGEDYHPSRRVAFSITPDGLWHTYRIALGDELEPLERVRIDPGSTAGPVQIRRLAIKSSDRSVELIGEELAPSIGSINLMTLESGANGLEFTATAPDPFVDFRLPRVDQSTSVRQVMRWLGFGVLAALMWALAEKVFFRVRRRLAQSSRIRSIFRASAARVSDPGLLEVSPSAMLLVAFVLAMSLVYVGLDLHQSSIGVWEEMYPAQPTEQLVDLGTPKRIRSDEWNTQAPWVLGQVMDGSPQQNVSIGGGNAPMLAAVPVAHSSAVAQVKFYGFHLFDVETGFSWWWAYKTFGLFLAFFWLLMLLTRGHLAASIIGSGWVYGSSFTQWWLSSHLPELLIGFAVSTIGAIYLLFSTRRTLVAVGAALAGYGFMNLLLHLYPPFIVPLAYLGIAILLGTAVAVGGGARIRQLWKWRAGCLSVSAVVTGFLAGSYLWDALPAMEAMVNTAYPGRRVSASGDVPLARLMYGYFEVFRVGEGRVPLPPTNASEASSFILLAPLLVLAIPFTAFMKRSNALLTALGAYCVVATLWVSASLPPFFESVMQGIGWAWSPSQRAVLGLGIGSILATTVLFARVQNGDLETRPDSARVMLIPFGVCSVLLFGWGLHGVDPEFFRPGIIALAALAMGGMTAGVVLGRTIPLAIGVAIAITPALRVNPVVSGLSAVQEKPVLVAARVHGEAESDRWAVVGDFVFSQGLKAQGLEVVTGSQMVPNRSIASALDPEAGYEPIWNRYAHIALRSDPGRPSPVYELASPDLYVIGLDVCGPGLAAIGVTHIAYTIPVPDPDLRCLIPLDAPADSGVRLFRFSRTAESERGSVNSPDSM